MIIFKVAVKADLYYNEPIFEYDEKEDDDDYNDSEEENLYCEACDRDFDSQEKLDLHLQEHQTCKIDGCTFTAHAKIVQKHIEIQHATGLYERMKHVMSDGDIEKWKTERKKRYPTAANKMLKEAERLEKEKRGEVIKDHNGKLRHDTVKKEKRQKNRKRKHKRQIKNNVIKEPVVKNKIYRGVLPFAGIALLDVKSEESGDESPDKETVIDDEALINGVIDTNDIEISDEEKVIEEPIVVEKPKLETVVPKILGLVADYGSESENDDPPDEVPIKKLKRQEDIISGNSEQSKELIQTAISVKEETKIKIDPNVCNSDKKLVKNEKKKIFDNKKQCNKHQKQNNAKYSNGKLRLLNKLLARSIQHERNTIFQCITFIAENNFFD